MKEKEKGNSERWQLYAILLIFAFALAVTLAAAQFTECQRVCTGTWEDKAVLSKTHAWEKQSSDVVNGTNYTLWACVERSQVRTTVFQSCYTRCRCPNNDVWEQQGEPETEVVDERIDAASKVLCTNLTMGAQPPALPCPC